MVYFITFNFEYKDNKYWYCIIVYNVYFIEIKNGGFQEIH